MKKDTKITMTVEEFYESAMRHYNEGYETAIEVLKAGQGIPTKSIDEVLTMLKPQQNE